MSARTVLAVAAVALSLSAGYAFAESEGNGNPFPFQAGQQATAGRAFVSDTGSSAYPELTGNTTQASSLAELAPAGGSEAAVQTVASLPRGFGEGSVVYAQTRSVDRYLAGRLQRARYLAAGTGRPGG